MTRALRSGLVCEADAARDGAAVCEEVRAGAAAGDAAEEVPAEAADRPGDRQLACDAESQTTDSDCCGSPRVYFCGTFCVFFFVCFRRCEMNGRKGNAVLCL